MAWFRNKRESPQIPPIASDPRTGPTDPNSSPRPYRSNANTYVPSRDGPDPYAAKAQARLGRGNPQDDYNSPYGSSDPYSRPSNNAPGDPYSRSGGNVDADRNELFSGYNPERQRTDPSAIPSAESRYDKYADDNYAPQTQEQEQEDVEGIKQATRFTKMESVSSTRNALRIAREAEETGRNALLKLGDQSEKISNTERHLDMGKAHATRANDRTDELKQLNKSIFRPVITFNKDKKRAAEEARIMHRHEDEREEREQAMGDIRETQNRIGRAATYGADGQEQPQGEEELTGRRRNVQPEVQRVRQDARKRFQFEKTASDDELEDELDDNLDDISDVTKRLRALAVAAGEEIDGQNKRLERISDKTTNLDDKVIRNTERLKKIK